MASFHAFKYSCPLQGRNIRLLEVRSGLNMLEVSLIEKSLDGAKFEALSYTWGDQAKKALINCNGQSLYIGSNLHDALCEWRRRRSTSPLWADAICINQESIEEKTRQVRLMRNVYANADRVIVWIGKGLPLDSDAYDLAKNLYQKCDGEKFDIDTGIYDFGNLDYQSLGAPGSLSHPSWTALFKIINNSWFSRVWVIQELLVARRSIMWRGALEFDTTIILWFALQVGRHRNLYNSFDIAMNSSPTSALMARSIASSYFDYKKRGCQTIYDTLSRHSGMGATDSRDRFFALAGVSAGLDVAFVNYEKTFREVACLVGKMTLLGFPEYELGPGGIEMLTLDRHPQNHRFPIDWLAFHANPRTHKFGIPSWVPDLLSPHSPGLLMSGFYNTSHLQEVRVIPRPQVRLNNGHSFKFIRSSTDRWQIPVPDDIQIKGAIFDLVKIVARDRPSLPKANSSAMKCKIPLLKAFEEVAQYEAAMVCWLSEIRLLADPTLSAGSSIMDGSSFDVFWRTLIYNCGPRFDYTSPNQRPGSGLGTYFGYWYLYKKLQSTKRWQEDLPTWLLQCRCMEELAGHFEEAEGRVRDARNFFVSDQGRIGWVPFRTLAGDQVCAFHGMRTPVILRSHSDGWEFIGACYVHGLMDGELWDLHGLQWDFIKLV